MLERALFGEEEEESDEEDEEPSCMVGDDDAEEGDDEEKDEDEDEEEEEEEEDEDIREEDNDALFEAPNVAGGEFLGLNIMLAESVGVDDDDEELTLLFRWTTFEELEAALVELLLQLAPDNTGRLDDAVVLLRCC